MWMTGTGGYIIYITFPTLEDRVQRIEWKSDIIWTKFGKKQSTKSERLTATDKFSVGIPFKCR